MVWYCDDDLGSLLSKPPLTGYRRSRPYAKILAPLFSFVATDSLL
jgi:hypothetical protein